MEQHRNGQRFDGYYLYERRKHQPYDYRRKGLLNRIMSHKVYGTDNIILKTFLKYYENIILFWFDYADILWNFKNYRFRNR